MSIIQRKWYGDSRRIVLTGNLVLRPERFRNFTITSLVDHFFKIKLPDESLLPPGIVYTFMNLADSTKIVDIANSSGFVISGLDQGKGVILHLHDPSIPLNIRWQVRSIFFGGG